MNVSLRSKLLSTFFRPANTWRQYARRHWSGHQALGASFWTAVDGGLPSSHRPEDLAWSSHQTKKKKNNGYFEIDLSYFNPSMLRFDSPVTVLFCDCRYNKEVAAQQKPVSKPKVSTSSTAKQVSIIVLQIDWVTTCATDRLGDYTCATDWVTVPVLLIDWVTIPLLLIDWVTMPVLLIHWVTIPVLLIDWVTINVLLIDWMAVPVIHWVTINVLLINWVTVPVIHWVTISVLLIDWVAVTVLYTGWLYLYYS